MTVTEFSAPHHSAALRFPTELPPAAFEAGVRIETNLDTDLLGYCGECDPFGDTPATMRISYRYTPTSTPIFTDVCGRYCAQKCLEELLGRGVYQRAVCALTVQVEPDQAPLPTDLHDLAGLGLACDHRTNLTTGCSAVGEFVVSFGAERLLTCPAHLAATVRHAERVERFAKPVVESLPGVVEVAA